MSFPRSSLRPVFVALIVLACPGEPPARIASQALLEGLPLPPDVARVEAAGGTEAVEAVYRSGQHADSVAAWYRRWFLQQGWRIAGDSRLPDGTVVLYAESGGRPAWVMIRSAPGAAGSTFSLLGTEPRDTAGAW